MRDSEIEIQRLADRKGRVTKSERDKEYMFIFYIDFVHFYNLSFKRSIVNYW